VFAFLSIFFIKLRSVLSTQVVRLSRTSPEAAALVASFEPPLRSIPSEETAFERCAGRQNSRRARLQSLTDKSPPRRSAAVLHRTLEQQLQVINQFYLVKESELLTAYPHTHEPMVKNAVRPKPEYPSTMHPPQTDGILSVHKRVFSS